MIGAAQPVTFIGRHLQRDPSMRTGLVEKSHPAVAGTKGHKILAQQPHPHWCSTRAQAFGTQHGSPELAHVGTHGSARANPRQQFVFFRLEHIYRPPSRATTTGALFIDPRGAHPWSGASTAPGYLLIGLAEFPSAGYRLRDIGPGPSMLHPRPQ